MNPRCRSTGRIPTIANPFRVGVPIGVGGRYGFSVDPPETVSVCSGAVVPVLPVVRVGFETASVVLLSAVVPPPPAAITSPVVVSFSSRPFPASPSAPSPPSPMQPATNGVVTVAVIRRNHLRSMTGGFLVPACTLCTSRWTLPGRHPDQSVERERDCRCTTTHPTQSSCDCDSVLRLSRHCRCRARRGRR
jgi:hypothetical protein